MKNISRRVFIKGLAVAGVAAAASTVLAGCNTNMIPGVDDGAEEPSGDSSAAQTLTFADPADADKTVSITLSDMKIDNTITSGLFLKLSAKVVNDSEVSVAFVPAYVNNANGINNNDYQVVVTAYPDDAEGNSSIVALPGLLDNLIVAVTDDNAIPFNTATATSGTVTEEGYLYLAIGDEDLKWNKVTVKMDVFKVVTKGAADEKQPVKTLKYTFSK